MTTTIWVILSVLAVMLGYFLVQLTRDIIWNRKLNAFQKKAGTTIKKEKTFFWFKRSYGALVSSVFMLTTIFSCVIVENTPQSTREKIYVNAQSVNNRETLYSLTNGYEDDYLFPDDVLSPPKGEWAPTEEADRGNGSSGERDFIGTNNQVEGVDEGDILKTDGNTIYYAPRYHNQVKVLSILNDGKAELTETLDLEDTYVDALYLTDDYLITVGYNYSYAPYFSSFEVRGTSSFIDYGWRSISYLGTVSVFNKSDLSLEYSLTVDSNFYEHRLIDNSLFLISKKSTYDDELRPTFTTKRKGEAENVGYLDYHDIYHFGERYNYFISVFTGLNLTDFTVNSQAFLGEIETIYANEDHLYTTSTFYSNNPFTSTIKSKIMKFKLNVLEAKIDYLGVGFVDGYIDNSYWLDEYENNLRVVTSSWNPVVNRLFVLSEDENYDKLTIIGSITKGLGEPNETVRSVTFHEQVAYIVTFFQVDPRYMIDFTDPTNPKILNAEKITGYSSYLYIWNKEDGGNEVVGLGFEADELTGQAAGLKLTAADDTKGIKKDIVIPYRQGDSYSYVYTEATYNPKAIMVSPKHNIFAFPITTYTYSGYTSEYLIYNIDFTKEDSNDIISGPIKIRLESYNYYFPIDRGVYISQSGDQPFEFIYILSPTGLVSFNLLTMEIEQEIIFKLPN